jgi:hypothetical protein
MKQLIPAQRASWAGGPALGWKMRRLRMKGGVQLTLTSQAATRIWAGPQRVPKSNSIPVEAPVGQPPNLYWPATFAHGGSRRDAYASMIRTVTAQHQEQLTCASLASFSSPVLD